MVEESTEPRAFRGERQGVGIEISGAALAEILAACRDAGRLETGGILIGYYNDSNDTAVVVEALRPPADSRSGPTWFHRGVAGVGDALRKRWKSSPRLYYLGEWHYHPRASAEPSPADLVQMVDIASDRGYRCPEPILVVLGGDPGGQVTLSVTLVRRGGAPIRLVERP